MKKNIVYNQKSRKKIDEKTLLNALEIVWANETVQKAEIEGNPDKDELKKIIKRKIIRNSRKIAQGVEELQDCIDKKQFLSQSGTSIDDLIGNLGGDSKLRECYKHYYCEEKP